MEGALFGAAALRMMGFKPLLLDLEAVVDDDHVIAIFRQGACWGAVAKSNYSGLRFREPVYRLRGADGGMVSRKILGRFREPVYRSLRELAMSYFEH
jgi:hypothetical protein